MPPRPGTSTGPEPLFSAPALQPAASDRESIPAIRSYADRPLGVAPTPVTALDQESFESSVPNVTQVYGALLGGENHYRSNREAAATLTKAIPGASRAARDNRAFLGRAVHYLAADAGGYLVPGYRHRAAYARKRPRGRPRRQLGRAG